MFVNGHAGIGKSRLADHAAQVARRDGGTVLMMQCASLRSSEALWPVDEAVNAFSVDDEGARPAPIDPMPNADLEPDAESPAKRREQRFHTLIDWIDALAGERRLLVVIEDLHWADPTTLEFVQRLVLRPQLGRFLLFLTSREPLPFVAEHVRSLDLRSLSADECALMIDHLVDDPDQRAAVRDAVITRSDGVPLFVSELAKVVVEGGSESLEFADDDTVPGTLHDLLVARVDQFAEQRHVAQALAAFGQPTDVASLASVLDQPGMMVLRDLDALEAGGLIRRVGDRYEFVHVLLRDAVLRLQLRPQRRAVHLRIADVLEQSRSAEDSVDDAVIAHHYNIAGDDERAARLWLRAGQHALRRNAQVEATELLQSALAAVRRLPDSPERTVFELDVVMALGPALTNSKGYGAPEVEETSRRAYELCEIVGEVPQRVPALINFWNFLAARAHHLEAHELSATIMELATATGRDDLVLQTCVCIGTSNAFLGRVDESIEYFERVVEMYDQAAHASVRFDYGTDPAVLALSYLTTEYVFHGDLERSPETAARSIALARDLEHPFSEVFALCFAAQARVFLDDLPGAQALLDQANELCVREAIPPIMPLTYSAVVQAVRGDDGAPEVCQFAADVARMAGLLVNLPYILAVHAHALSVRGDHVEAEAKMAESFATMEATGEWWAEAEIRRLRALMLERRGAPPEEVEACFRLAIENGRRMGAYGFAGFAEQSLAGFQARRT